MPTNDFELTVPDLYGDIQNDRFLNFVRLMHYCLPLVSRGLQIAKSLGCIPSFFSSLPEVPPLSEVPCIFVDLPDAALLHLQEEVNDYGRVLARAPVQISEASERPGGLLIKWAEVQCCFLLPLATLLSRKEQKIPNHLK